MFICDHEASVHAVYLPFSAFKVSFIVDDGRGCVSQFSYLFQLYFGEGACSVLVDRFIRQ